VSEYLLAGKPVFINSIRPLAQPVHRGHFVAGIIEGDAHVVLRTGQRVPIGQLQPAVRPQRPLKAVRRIRDVIDENDVVRAVRVIGDARHAPP